MASKRTLRLRRVRDKVSMVDCYPVITGEQVVFYSDSPRQVRCLIHGQDLHPSARIYPDSGLFYCHGCKLSLNSIGYYMNYNGFEFTDNPEVESMLLFFEQTFDLDQHDLDQFSRDSDEDEEISIDYQYEFKKMWFDTNDLACKIKDKCRQEVFNYLDRSWDMALGPQKKFRRAWQFLFKLKETYLEEFSKLS